VTELGVGVGTGSALFLVLACGQLPNGPLRVPRGALALRWLWLLGRAAGEELVWRRLILAALALAVGTGAALLLSAIGFAAWHGRLLGRRCAVHLATGAGFGGAYLLAGLGGAALAHATYNVLVDYAVQSERNAG
jgi:membrane protease YdiL (CAAX protease family)